MNTSEADEEADDSGALAAVGCLRAISTILESISSLPHLFAQIEPILLPIMQRMLTTDGQGNVHLREYSYPSIYVYTNIHIQVFICVMFTWIYT